MNGSTSIAPTSTRERHPSIVGSSSRSGTRVKVWYPAAPSGARPERYLDPRTAQGSAAALKLPSFVLSHLSLVGTHAARDVPLAERGDPFPVVLYSHGYPGLAEQNTFQVEELASHGYVVFSINHTYDAAFVAFGDGTVAAAEIPDDIRRRLDTVEKKIGPRLSVAVADARFVLDQITKLNEADPRWRGRLDLGRVGYFGHSFGGATAHAALATDPRFRAGINMDGAHFGVSSDARPSQPFLLMNGDALTVTDAQLAQFGMTRREVDAFLDDVKTRWDRSCTDAKGPRYRAIFPGVSHMGFSDMSLIAPLVSPGTVPAREAHRLINQYTLAFFQAHLEGKASALLTGAPADPAVKFTVF
jgi:dienelactone hydrolase